MRDTNQALIEKTMRHSKAKYSLKFLAIVTFGKMKESEYSTMSHQANISLPKC